MVKLFTPSFINSNHACKNSFLFISGSPKISADKSEYSGWSHTDILPLTL